jgi:tetratricopeptide (TPR) repeat protein
MLNARLLIAGAAMLLLAGGGGAWWFLAGDTDLPLPTPPEPPRLVDAPEFDQCVRMLDEDPEGARTLADTWAMRGGGEGAAHCAALAMLSLGDAERAAEALERIATRSEAGIAARAAVLGQAGEAWSAAGRPQRAHAALTLALALTPADPGLLTARALAALALDRPAEALADLERAVATDATIAEAWVLKAAAAGPHRAGGGERRRGAASRPRQCRGAARARHHPPDPGRCIGRARGLGTRDRTRAGWCGGRSRGTEHGVDRGRAGEPIALLRSPGRHSAPAA